MLIAVTGAVRALWH